MKWEGLSMISNLVDYLNNNLLIAHYCGFDISRPLPSYWTFDRFLIHFDHSILSGIMRTQVLSLADKGIIDTSFIGLDSTVALNILADTHRFLSVTECTFLADKGYDAKNIYHQVKRLYEGECIIPLNKRNTKNSKLLSQGNPVCEAGLVMWKDSTFSDRGRTRQKFCCLLKSFTDTDCPCHHKNFYNGKKHYGCPRYMTIPDDLVLLLDRNSKYFKNAYSLRTECERYHSRFKNTGQERMWVRNQSSVANLNTIAHICLLAVAAITIPRSRSYRKLKFIKRIA